MTLHRQAAKRDANEPAIRARLKTHGWHTEQVSGKGMPDLIGWSKHRVNVHLLEVKKPGERPTEPQEEKWQELLERGIRVYVLRTPNDVDYLVKGHLEPWTPGEAVTEPKRKAKVHKPGVSKARDFKDMCIKPYCVTSKANGPWCLKHGKPYAPPQTRRADASAIAAETFAPATPCSYHRCLNAVPCPIHALSGMGRR